MMLRIIYTILITFISSINFVNAQIEGVVYEDTNKNNLYDSQDLPLVDILVSNGKDIVKTDANGSFNISILPSNTPIFIIKPKGYISPIKNSKVLNFYKISSEITHNYIHFPLYKNDESNTVRAVILGDPQVDVIDDVHHVGKLVTEELATKQFDFLIPVGDLTFDNLSMFKALSTTLGVINKPVFYTIGNHDLDYQSPITNTFKAYENHFGPTYYAFEYGTELFLVLNNIDPHSKGKFTGRINEIQYQFVQNLLNIKKPKKLNVFMHIPLEQMTDKNRFLRVFKRVKDFFIVVGHTHTQYHRYFDREPLKKVHELVAGAVCGAWWQGPHNERGIPFALMYDGTEKGYWIADYDQNNVKYTYKVSGKPATKQMNIWAPETKEWSKELNELNEPFIYANVFAADENTKVNISFDNQKTWIPMRRYKGVSPFLKRLYFLQNKGHFKSLQISEIPLPKNNSEHLWRVSIPKFLKKGTYLLAVKAENKDLNFTTTNYKLFWND